jgi:Carboxypeptidase regulatory-like domain
MTIRRRVARVAFVVILPFALLFPGTARAQQTSAIAGLVKDSSGAVLPGVTVEASSPALIEKVRTVATDNEGRYNIVDLRPGAYTVIFTLAGFSTFKREGVELMSGFTASVNADLAVGSLEETITVSGEAPLVDTRNVRKQNVVSDELLETLPTSTKHVQTVVTLTPGFTGIADVSGTYSQQIGSTFHGKTGTKLAFDGMGIENMAGTGNSSYQLNSAVVEEMVLQTTGISAETNADGAVVNVVPKEGGNIFRGTVSGFYANDSLESNNLTDALLARGLTTVNETRKIYDEGVSFGGPIRKDRLWFFGAIRSWGFRKTIAGIFWNQTQGTPFYTPDPDRPADLWEWYDSNLVRLTWQASQKNKFNFIVDNQEACNCGPRTAAQAPEASFSYRFDPNYFFQVAWSSPITNRLLLEGGGAAVISHWHQFLMPGVHYEDIPINDQGLGVTYNALATYIGHPQDSDRYDQRFSVSYVTGSHAFKGGVSIEEGISNIYRRANGNRNYVFRNAVPVSITQWATPWLQKNRIIDSGVYAQDQWTMNRLTINLGLRFDYFYGWVPAQQTPGTTTGWGGASDVNAWVPPRSFAPVKRVPAWKDLNPRVGAAYDLFGDGRTALKVSLGRYVRKTSVDLTIPNNPIETSVNSVTRSWNDANGNYVPDCNLGNFADNGECGPISNPNFGGREITNRWADDVLHGFGIREHNWDFQSEVQHQLSTGVSVTGGYYRNWYGSLRVTDNLLVSPADFDPFCITAPKDARLPGGGGYQVCGLYDIKPESFGRVSNLVTQASNFGKQTRINDFFNVSLNMRLPSGARLGGGIDTGRTVSDQCLVVDAPGVVNNLFQATATTSAAWSAPFAATTINGQGVCKVVTPFKAQTQIKLNGSYPLPAGFVVSGALQNISGPDIAANYAATTAEIAPSLGRNLAGGARTATVPLVAPMTSFEGRITRLDVRLTKVVNLGSRVRLQGNLDAYNALNNSSIRAVNSTYGPRWLLPTQILDARIIEIGGQVSF